MKKIIFSCLLLFCMTASLVLAQEQGVFLEAGTASGAITRDSGDFDLDNELSGQAMNLVYMNTFDSNLMVGAGYHSYEASGDVSDTVSIESGGFTFNFTLEASETLKLSGVFGMIGYNLEFLENFRFQPQLRLGLGNKIEISGDFKSDVTVTGFGSIDSSSSSDTESDSINPTIIVIPVSYKINDFIVGLQYHSITAGMDFDNSVEVRINSAFALSAGYLF